MMYVITSGLWYTVASRGLKIYKRLPRHIRVHDSKTIFFFFRLPEKKNYENSTYDILK